MTAQLYRWRKERQVVTVEGERQIISAPSVLWMWVGAVSTAGATVTARLSANSSTVRLVVSLSDRFTSPIYSDIVASGDLFAKLAITGLAANTRYYYGVEVDGRLSQDAGTFRTLPSGAHASFRVAFAGDASTGSDHAVFDQIREQAPLCFIHLGDLHYEDIATDNAAAFRSAYDAVFAADRQSRLYREVPTCYVWDDHDFGAPDSDGSSPSKAAAAAAYRQCVPHLTLEHETAIYQSFAIGRVLFLITDQRSEASVRSATDDASKSMLGATQKAWFKSSIEANPDKLIVWVCPRVFGRGPASGVDHWGGFSTERTEIADFLRAECPGRCVVLSADMHALGIDDGTNHDFATGGGCPIPTFQAAPLDRTAATGSGGATYSEGGLISNDHQFGVMEVTDHAGSGVTVDWTGYGADGTRLVTYRFTVDLS